ncbi:hypothetical protein HOY82DRAFT_483919, partial [Tuber indicum]
GFKLLHSVLWGLPNVQPYDLLKPDLRHVVSLGIFEAHLMKWVIGFLKKFKRLQSLDAVWKSLAPYHGYSALNKEYSRISRWTGKAMRNLVKVILPCFAASLRRPSAAEHPIFTQALTCIQSIVDFTVMSQYMSHTDAMIQYPEQFLNAFHDHKDIFKKYQKDKQTMRKVRENVDFNLVKIHLLSHFKDHVWRFGNIQMYSTESGESNHKTMIKVGYRRSNKNDTSHQIRRTYARLDSFKIQEMNVEESSPRPIKDRQHDQKHKRKVGSVTERPTGITSMIGTVS